MSNLINIVALSEATTKTVKNDSIDSFLKKAANELNGCKFISLVYTNKNGEKSRQLLNWGAKYKNAIQKDSEFLNSPAADSLLESLKEKYANEFKTVQKKRALKLCRKVADAKQETTKERYYLAAVADMEKFNAKNNAEKALYEMRVALSDNKTQETINRSNGQKNAYISLFDGLIKYHIETGVISIFAQTVPDSKEILEEGVYKATNKATKTKIKDAFRAKMRSTKFRHFHFTQIKKAKVNGNIFEIE